MSAGEKFLWWAGTLLTLWVGLNVWWFASTTEWRRRGLYVWRVRKAWALFNLPIVCRHFGYVGMTGSRLHRDRQHLFGTATDVPAPWSDLNPKVYPLPCWLPGWEFARKVQEKWWILLLWPIYNVHWNVANPRRIPRKYAYELKSRRQSGGRRLNVGYKLVRAPVTVLIYLVLWQVGRWWVT